MSEITSAIILRSEMNEWIDICITVSPYEDFLKVQEIAEESYAEWFDSDTCECISDYIKRKLDEAECSYEMYLRSFNEDKEEQL